LDNQKLSLYLVSTPASNHAKEKQICYTRPVKKHNKKQKQTPVHSEKSPSAISMAIANVPVKISIWQGKTKLEEYEDEIALEFSDTSPEGKTILGSVCISL